MVPNIFTGTVNFSIVLMFKTVRVFPLVVVFFIATTASWAQSIVYESEPSNTPATANKVSGAVQLIGTMDASDQDAFEWSVSDVDAAKRWTFELQGIPGELTIVEVMRVEYAENGVDVRSRQKLFTMGTRDGSRPSVHEDLLFEPGEYVLGIAHNGSGGGFRPPAGSLDFDRAVTGGQPAAKQPPGAYRLSIREGDALRLKQGSESAATRVKALKMRPGAQSALLSDSADSWFQVDMGEKDALQKWDITGQVPVGRQAKATLFAPDNTPLATAEADGKGKFSFPDLSLGKGTYFIEMKAPESGFIRSLQLSPAGLRIVGAEAEPNDNWAQANRVAFTQAVTGKLAKSGDSDYFRFALGAPVAEKMLTLRLETGADSKLTLCLTDGKGQKLQCRENTGVVELPDLVLEEGEWGFFVERGKAGSAYSVALVEQGAIAQGSEVEPNDKIEYAAAIPDNNRIKGRFAGEDTDFYKIVVGLEPQLWRIQVIGKGLFELAYYDGSGSEKQRYRVPRNQARARLDNLFLLPGIHYFRVTGQGGGQYTLLAKPIGQPDPNGEREPNDDRSQMHSLQFGQTRTGLLEEPQDQDNYRFHLANWDRIQLTLEPPADGAVTAELYWDGGIFKQARNPEVGKRVVLEGLFPPGDYRLALAAKKTSEAEYKLALKRLPRFGCPADCEPNDNLDFASVLPADRVLQGVTQDWRDSDWYRLPVFDEPTQISFTAEQQPRVELVSREYGARSLLSWDSAAKQLKGTIPAGTETYAQVTSNGAYRIAVDFPFKPGALKPAQAPLALSLKLANSEVAAYRSYGQKVVGELKLKNSASTPRQVQLESATSDVRWISDLDKKRFTVPAAGEVTVPIALRVPADAWAVTPVRLSILAATDDGARSETFAEIRAGRESRAVNPVPAWPIPDALRGGFNVAWSGLGGRWLGGLDTGVGKGFDELFDGMAVKNQGMQLRGQAKRESVNVDVALAGNEPVAVAGIAISELAISAAPQFLKNVDFSVSLDGKNYTPALKSELLPILSEQVFVLEQPVPARFARLTLKNGFDGRAGSALSFGEFKVIATPGLDISNGKGFNLVDASRGGHVVWSRPGAKNDELLKDDGVFERQRVREGEAYEVVIGFHHDRAAQITRLEWVDGKKLPRDQKIERVTVSVSNDSPIGPWQTIGDWTLSPKNLESVLDLKAPTWARFVKFSVAPQNKPVTLALADAIRIWERPTQEGYRSILGEWGDASQAAIYEALHPLKLEPDFVPAGNESKARAAQLGFDQQAGGQVLLGKHLHWYRIDVPNGQNFLSLKVGGDPTVRASVAVEKGDGSAVPVVKNNAKSTPQQHIFEAVVEPGGTYFLKVEEPPRNVLFLWDTSASVGAYLPVIYNAMLGYAKDVVPGKDAVNLLPFGGHLLSKDWYGQPYILQTILNDYPRKESSSAAEETLAKASKALAPRAGTKAIVMVTDAATNAHPPVWQAFQEVQPQIFALGVGSQGAFGRNPVREQDLMQDWSRVNGGHYSYMESEGAMEIAFDRAMTMLRRPAAYTLEAGTAYKKPLGPGKLRVARGSKDKSSQAAIELILDASGSMLKRLDGKRRMAIAKEVLTEVVSKHIPPGTPVALRVFGHRQANACRSDLEVALKPLNSASMLKAIQSVEAMNLAKTPIAASLAAVESDLKGAKGRKIVVLVTDGEETCEGDPAATVQKLRDKGVDVTLNIVGFAIDSAELESSFQSWAKLGGGRYFQARDQRGLSAAVQDAVMVPYSVYDQTGTLVATGLVGGEAVLLEQGHYRVVVQGSPAKSYPKVEVTAGKELLLD
jgi:Mg-chelatase subunit ChlD